MKSVTQTCNVPGCGRRYRALGLCDMHYQRQRAGLPLDWTPLKKSGCRVQDCDRPHSAKGLCWMHRNRQKQGLVLETPSRITSHRRPDGLCLDCLADITHRAKSAIRCESCAKKQKGDKKRQYERRKASGAKAIADRLYELRHPAKRKAIKQKYRKANRKRKALQKHMERLLIYSLKQYRFEVVRDLQDSRIENAWVKVAKSVQMKHRVRAYHKRYRMANLERLRTEERERTRQRTPEQKATLRIRRRHRELLLAPIPKGWKARRFKEQAEMCGGCRRRFPCASSLTIDHIVPLSKGGDNSPTNLQLLCRDCNRIKSDKHDSEWRRDAFGQLL